MQFQTGDWRGFGAHPLGDGTTRFRIWAPSVDRLDLVIRDGTVALPLQPTDGGWFTLVTDQAPVGTAYHYRLPDGLCVPDPASRAQSGDAHGPSVVVDPGRLPGAGHLGAWRGRPWHETVLLEAHVGTATPDGTFAGLAARLDHFAATGVTAIELMPLADFPGARGWGYDGVLPFAPDVPYGSPDDLSALIAAAHARGLMVFLDVVYNHFGPDGNYLHTYAAPFFTDAHHTPWGAAIDFSQRPVRDFFIANAVYWLEAYGFDGLRFDAVHAIHDDSDHHILTELADTVRHRLPADRQIHLVLENDANQAVFLSPDGGGHTQAGYVAQWNDDYHHVLHVLLTGEADGYYEDYDQPIEQLGAALTSGYVYQGQPSRHRGGDARGQPSGHLPHTAFVNFLQNHDQIGNRAFGDRLTTLADAPAVDAALAVLLMAPQIPMLYMGEEWGATEPFQYFCDFHDELATAVRDGRRREFGRFAQFADPAVQAQIPDPNAETTFAVSRLVWPDLTGDTPQGRRHRLVARLLEARRDHVVPILPRLAFGLAVADRLPGAGLRVTWTADDGSRLVVICNLSDQSLEGEALPDALLDTTPVIAVPDTLNPAAAVWPPWSVQWGVQSGVQWGVPSGQSGGPV